MPTLLGRSVTLRPWREGDVGAVQEASHDDLIPLMTTVPTTHDEGAALAFIDRQHQRRASGAGFSFAVADRTERAVGQIGLWFGDSAYGRLSLGYWILASERGNGYASDALATLTDWARELDGIDRLDLSVEPWNEASWRTAERAGFVREGLLRSWERVAGKPRDMFMYALVTSADSASAVSEQPSSAHRLRSQGRLGMLPHPHFRA